MDRSGQPAQSASGIVGRALVFFAMAGCYQWPTVTPDPLATTDPQITAATVTCDETTAEWSFQVVTDAWTGNGSLYLSTDGSYVEQDSLVSTSAASDGTSDTLTRTLGVVATWRDAVSDTSTAFGCNTPELAGVMTVYTRDGSAVSNCLGLGTDPARWQAWNADLACSNAMTGDTWPTPADTGDSG